MALLELDDKVYKIPNKVMEAFEDMSDYIKELEEKNKRLDFCMQDTYDSVNDICGELQQRIDKAIEYIEKLFILEDDNVIYEFKNDEIKPLLKILKGEE